MDIPIAANVLGTIGAICWSVQVSYQLPPPSNSILLAYPQQQQQQQKEVKIVTSPFFPLPFS